MSELSHKDRTVQDILNGLSPEQRDTMDIVIGAAVEDEVIDDDQVIADYRALPVEVIYLIDFIIGGVLAKEEGELSQDNLRVTTFLAHYGVKGMQWGVRKRDDSGGSRPRRPGVDSGSGSKSQKKTPPPLIGNGSNARLSGSTMNTKENRAAARKQVRKGTATAEVAHVAALKSTGHRVANAFLGDKTYWKGMAITAGVAGATVGVGFALPLVLPASTLASIGSAVYFAGGSLIAPSPAVAAAAGTAAVQATATSAAYIGASIASTTLQVTNLVRAVRGNSRIDASYERLGANMISTQKKGAERAAKILSKDGGTSRRKTRNALKQSDPLVDNFLAHHVDTSLRAMKPGA